MFDISSSNYLLRIAYFLNGVQLNCIIHAFMIVIMYITHPHPTLQMNRAAYHLPETINHLVLCISTHTFNHISNEDAVSTEYSVCLHNQLSRTELIMFLRCYILRLYTKYEMVSIQCSILRPAQRRKGRKH